MIRDITYSKETLAEIFSLNKGDIEVLIHSEGVPIFSTSEKAFVGYLPSLNSSFFIRGEKMKQRLGSNIVSANYEVILEDSIVSIASKQPSLYPATTYLYKNLWLPESSKLLTPSENFSILISSRKELPFYCGHNKLISRLAESMSGDIYIESFISFCNRMEN